MEERRDTARGVDHDPFKHPRDRRGQFRDNGEKLKNQQPGSRLALFSFVSRDVLPHVDGGQIHKIDHDTTEITLVVGGQQFVHVHEGLLDAKALLKVISGYQIKRADMQKVALTLDSRTKIDDMIIEKANGFSSESGLPVVGNKQGEHWVLYTWNQQTFWNDDTLTRDQFRFLSEHAAAIGHKVQPGDEAEINYFKTAKLALDRMDMLRSQHGAA